MLVARKTGPSQRFKEELYLHSYPNGTVPRSSISVSISVSISNLGLDLESRYRSRSLISISISICNLAISNLDLDLESRSRISPSRISISICSSAPLLFYPFSNSSLSFFLNSFSSFLKLLLSLPIGANLIQYPIRCPAIHCSTG